MELINKETIVQWAKDRLKSFDPTEITSGRYELALLLEVINTLETKELDLEKAIDDYIYTRPYSKTGIPNGWKHSWRREEVHNIAKHFFELGIKVTQKEE